MQTVKSVIKDYGTVAIYFAIMTIIAISIASCSTPRYAGEHFRVADCPTWAKR